MTETAEQHSTDKDALRPSHTFRSGEGLSPWHLHCADPYDLGPPADIIVRAINETKSQMANEDDTRPLVVIIAEDHAMPSHKLLQTAVMNRLIQQQTDFSFHTELPHNDWHGLITECIINTGLDIPESLRYSCGQYDPEGRATLSASLLCVTQGFSPEGSYEVMSFLLGKNIRTVFNDAAFTDIGIIDIDDPVTIKAMRDIKTKIRPGIPGLSEDGMAIRNQCMATRPTTKDLTIQITGRSHLFGYSDLFEKESGYHAYESSLCSAYRKAGAMILPVFISSANEGYGVNTMPEAAYDDLKRSVIIDGLSSEQFFIKKLAEMHGLPFTEGAERKFMTEKLHDSTAQTKLAYTESKDDDKSKHLETTMEEAKKVLDRFASTCPK